MPLVIFSQREVERVSGESRKEVFNKTGLQDTPFYYTPIPLQKPPSSILHRKQLTNSHEPNNHHLAIILTDTLVSAHISEAHPVL